MTTPTPAERPHCRYRIPIGAAYISCDGAHETSLHAEDRNSAYRDGMLFAAQIVHAEARWQAELDQRGIVGAQTVALRMTEVEKAINGIVSTFAADDVPGTPALDAHTPRTAPQTRSGGTESGEEPFVATSALGDKLRALGVRFQRGVSNSDPANDEDIELSGYNYWATVQGIEALAVEADGMTAERDEWKRRRDAAVQECRFLHQDGLSRHDWHAKHCGAVEAADTLRAQVERVRALADAWDAMADAMMSRDDAELVTASAKSVRDALDGASSKAVGNGEAGA